MRTTRTGTGSTAPTQIDKGTMINNGAEYAFNNSYESAEYVGFEYELGIRNGNSKGRNGQKSNALQVLESWFRTNLSDEFGNGINTAIDTNAGFCGDRVVASGTGIGNSQTNYAPRMRTDYGSYEPTFVCGDKDHDLFTYTGSNQGTKSLAYPIGLTTIDEQSFAGCGPGGDNTRYYLYNGQEYWTLSPIRTMSGSNAHGAAEYGGGLVTARVDYEYGLRPVINLMVDTLKYGDGSASNPFRTVS